MLIFDRVYCNLSIIFFFIGGVIPVVAQTPYFQQGVNYDISVRLDDENHILRGHISIGYFNHSSDALDTLWLHVYPNAFANKNSAFGKQLIPLREDAFYFAKPEDMGGIDSLKFEVQGRTSNWGFHPEHKDIVFLTLGEPLLPGDSLLIECPMRITIPKNFSRFGHVGQSYQISQWYPKMAVYDRAGWHLYPYLQLGEFYGEFGRYEVEITLPANYKVGGTGQLTNPEEEAYLLEIEQATREKIGSGFQVRPQEEPSASEVKTIRFVADRVHDMAWFANKHFYFLQQSLPLSNGDTVLLKAFFLDSHLSFWVTALDKTSDMVQYFSEEIGPYAYPSFTLVQARVVAGRAMEYPGLVVFDPGVEEVEYGELLPHETAHQWFYGMLGFDERQHPWMDEGLSTFYEKKWRKASGQKAFSIQLPGINIGASGYKLGEIGYLYQASRNRDQPSNLPSDQYSRLNYYLSVYEKPANSLAVLEKHLGPEVFGTLIRSFFEKWKFKHPGPEDFRVHFEASVDQPLEWFFDGLIQSTGKIDYGVSTLKKNNGDLQLTLQNKGDIAAPVEIGISDKDLTINQMIYPGFAKDTTILFRDIGQATSLELDPDHKLYDVVRRNNFARSKGVFGRYKPLNFRPFFGIDKPATRTLYYAPTIGWNNYDKTMAGISLTNSSVFAKPLEFYVNPMWAFVTNQWNTLTEGRIRVFPIWQGIQEVQLGLSFKRFTFDRLIFGQNNTAFLAYRRLSPYLKILGTVTPNDPVFRSLTLRALFVERSDPQYNANFDFTGLKNVHTWIYRVAYEQERRSVVNPYRINAYAEQQSLTLFSEDVSYIRLGLSWLQAYHFQKKKKFTWRLNAAGLLKSSGRNYFEQLLPLTFEGFNDYSFDDFFYGRTDQDGLWAQQISIREGGMKVPLGSPFRNQLGQSNDWIASINLKSDLPIKLPAFLPIKVYFDLGYAYHPDLKFKPMEDPRLDPRFLFSGGLALEFEDGLFGIYFPLVNSENVNFAFNQLPNQSYWRRVSFAVDLHKLHPWRLIDRFQL